MLKKLTLLAISVMALIAFAAPAAQATGPLITNEEGVAPTYLTATSTNTIVHTTVGTFECTTTILTVHLTENANTTAKGHGTGTMTGTPTAVGAAKHLGHCPFGSGITEFTSVTVSDLHLTKHGGETTGTASISLTYDWRSGGTGTGLTAECTWGGTIPVKKTGIDTVNISGNIAKTAGGAFCPGTGTITGDFTLVEDQTGRSIHIH